MMGAITSSNIGANCAAALSAYVCFAEVANKADLYTTARVEVLRSGATTRSLVMSIIPLDLQRRFEQRWAARFSRPNPSDAPRKYQGERQSEQVAAPGKDKRKARRVEPAGVRPVLAA